MNVRIEALPKPHFIYWTYTVNILDNLRHNDAPQISYAVTRNIAGTSISN